MILKDLLKSVDIDKVLAIIKEWYYKDDPEFTQEPYYRDAYKEMIKTDIKPEASSNIPSSLGEIWIRGNNEDDIEELRRRYPEYSKLSSEELTWPSASYPDDHEWAIVLGRRIVVKNNIKISNEQIAALCMHEMTWFGYSQEEINDYARKLHEDIEDY